MRSRMQRTGVAALACAGLLVLAGCSSGDEPGPTADTTWIDYYIEEARAGGGGLGVVASAEQIEILERAKAQGEITIADVIEALNNAKVCLEDVGLRLTMYPPQTYQGFEQPRYGWGGPLSMSPDEVLALGDPCLEAESHFVEGAYQMQPRALEAKGAYFDKYHRPVMLACLERNGVAVEPDATEQELYRLAIDLIWPIVEQHPDDDNITQTLRDQGRDCIEEIGLLPDY